MKNKMLQAFNDFGEMFLGMTPLIFTAIIVLLLFVSIGWVSGMALRRGLQKSWKDTIVLNFIVKAVRWIFYSIGILAALHMLGFGGIANSLIAGAGISAIIVGFAFKDLAENFLAGIMLAINRPFNMGNIIQVDNHKGTVKGLDLRTTHIRNSEGKDIYIPNALLIKNVLTNFTKDGFLRLEFAIGFDTNTKIQDARLLILEYLGGQDDVLKNPEPNVITENLGEYTIDVKVLFWVDVLKSKTVSPAYLGETIRGRVIREIADLLLDAGFNMPSQVIEHKMYDSAQPLLIKRQDQ